MRITLVALEILKKDLNNIILVNQNTLHIEGHTN
jgi:hypothetical protein